MSSQDLNQSFLIVMGVTGINSVCNVARSNQDVFPAGILVKNFLGGLLPSMGSKTLHCHWPLPDSEDRELYALCSLVKAHRCEERLLFISNILRNFLYASTHTIWLLILNTALLIIFHQKERLLYVHIDFFPSIFLNINKFWFWRSRKRVFYLRPTDLLASQAN